MSLERKAIRQAVVDLLIGKTAVQGRVYANRTRPIQPEELPCIVVWTKSDKSEVFETAPRRYKRTVTVSIQILDTADEGLDDRIDDICQQIELIIGQNDRLKGTATDSTIVHGEGDIPADGEQLIGWWRIDIEAEYLKYSPEYIEENLAGLQGLNIKYDVAPADGRIEAEDKLELPQ